MIGYMKKAVSILLSGALLCLCLPGPAAIGSAAADNPSEYSPALSFVHDPPLEERDTEYVLALDNSGSMLGSVGERNAAAAALIRSLPYEKTRATAFFFSDTCEVPLDIRPMSQEEFRQELATTVEQNTTAMGGTDLGLMMRTAVNLFSGEGRNQSVKHVLYVVTDGQSDGRDGLAQARDQEFFSMCEAYRETVDIYVIYVSDSAPPGSLCTGLNTQPITLEDSSSETLDACTSQLATWNGTEYAKVLSISDIDLLETALMLLRFSNGDTVFHRKADQDTIISFEIPPLCVQELTIALSGGASVKETLGELKRETDEADLLRMASMGEDPSTATIYREHGLAPGTYTLAVKTDAPVSVIFSYQYGFQIRFGLAGLDEPLAPPAGTEAVLQMQMLAPDGTPVEEANAPELSMNIYRRLADGTSELYASVKNGGTFSAAALDEEDCLMFYPVVSYSGVESELDSFWEVCPSEKLPVIDAPSYSAAWPVFAAIVAALILAGCIYLYLCQKLRQWNQARSQKKNRQSEDDVVKEAPQFTGDFIRAGIRWQITTQKNGKPIYLLGGLGLTDGKGKPRGGRDLSKEKMWRQTGSGVLKDWLNPLDFCLWSYSQERKCTELILREDDGTKITYSDVLHHEYTAPCGKYRFFGVNETARYGTVTLEIKKLELKASFQLEYYREKEPLYCQGGEA